MMKTLFVRQQVQTYFQAHPAKFALFKQIVLKEKSADKKEEVPSLRNIELFCKSMHRLDPGRFKSYGGKRPPRDCMKRMRAEQSRFTKRLFDVYARQYHPDASTGGTSGKTSCSSMTLILDPRGNAGSSANAGEPGVGGGGDGDSDQKVPTSLGQGNFFRFFFEEGLDDVIKGFGGVKQALESLKDPAQLRPNRAPLAAAILATQGVAGASSRSRKDDGVFCKIVTPASACCETSTASPRGATSSAVQAGTPNALPGWAASAQDHHPSASKRRRQLPPGISVYNVST